MLLSRQHTDKDSTLWLAAMRRSEPYRSMKVRDTGHEFFNSDAFTHCTVQLTPG